MHVPSIGNLLFYILLLIKEFTTFMIDEFSRRLVLLVGSLNLL